MLVAVTGSTGYVGAFAVRHLLDAGHQVRVLVRDPERLQTTVGTLEVSPSDLEIVTGDVRDSGAAQSLLAGADSVIHAAAMVTTLRRTAESEAFAVNVEATSQLADLAVAAGCDPIVHVSSTAALFDPALSMITVDSPPTTGAAGLYLRTKALAEAEMRSRQAQGDPIVLVYPGGVLGPGAGPALGEVSVGLLSMLKAGCCVLGEGGWTLLDVRDLASILCACQTPGAGPRRYMAGGNLLSLREVSAIIGDVTGRRFPVLPTPGWFWRGAGRVVDIVRRGIPFDTIFTAEAMTIATQVQPTDDRLVFDELGVSYRSPRETIAAGIRALHARGLVTDRQAGRLAEPSSAS